jgi:hypothetical protein
MGKLVSPFEGSARCVSSMERSWPAGGELWLIRVNGFVETELPRRPRFGFVHRSGTATWRVYRGEVVSIGTSALHWLSAAPGTGFEWSVEAHATTDHPEWYRRRAFVADGITSTGWCKARGRLPSVGLVL